MSPARRLLDRLHGEGGFSLTELLVSIAIMSLVSAAIITSTVAVQRNLGVANATMNDMATNRIAIERVGQLIRGAVSADGNLSRTTSALDTDPSVPPTAQRITFFTVTGQQANQNPIRVQLDVVAGAPASACISRCLVERIWDPQPLVSDGTTPTFPGTPRTRVIVRNVIDPDLTTPAIDLFQFWSHAYDGSDPESRCGREVPTAGMGITQMRSVDSVGYRVVINEADGYESAPSDLQGWARFASNIDLGYSTSFTSAECLDVRGFGYDDVYEGP